MADREFSMCMQGWFILCEPEFNTLITQKMFCRKREKMLDKIPTGVYNEPRR